ncbi:MAG: GGDEF domain-containing protein [Synergistaceae bacterium]|jgi:diguanylate cyclase (GGDEF)-like protein|nr:GGDEF domain-containing protein [Synergistaceae bacterium]
MYDISSAVLDSVRSVIVCASDMDTHEVLMATGRLKHLVGTVCGEKDRRGCPFCRKFNEVKKNAASDADTATYESTYDGRWYRVTESAAWSDGLCIHLSEAVDISDFKEREKTLRALADEMNAAASLDPLTGAYNRHMGTALMESAYRRMVRTNKRMTVCFMDLDGLKKVNDTHGHHEGDKMLTKFAGIVKDVIRHSDVFCRWGGDEFVLLLEDCDASQARDTTMKRLNDEVNSFNTTAAASNEFTLSFSYGLEEVSPDPEHDLGKIIASADRKMYDDKSKKKARRSVTT